MSAEGQEIKMNFFREEGSYSTTLIKRIMLNISCQLSVGKRRIAAFYNGQLTTDPLRFNIMGLKRIIGRFRHGETGDST
jgi:hypothetical protein